MNHDDDEIKEPTDPDTREEDADNDFDLKIDEEENEDTWS